MERRLAAILAADVEGYSRHTEIDEEVSTATLRVCRGVVEEAIAAHKGHIFSSAGDGVVAEFPSIVEAIRCAVEIQNEIAERNASFPEKQQMQFRIGVNLGDVISEENNLYGTGVNVAVRIQQLAEPGGICISQNVYDQVRKIVEIPFQDIGERRLKNIADPVHVYRILPAPLPWFRTLFSRANFRQRRLGLAAGMLLLLLAAAVGSFYLRQPAVLWGSLLGDVALPEHPTIAVLPFDDMSPTHDQQYLADGITADVITGLAKFPDFIVMSRSATFAYEDKPTVRQVGEDLNVRYVVKGSIRRSDQDMRVTAQLIDASTGRVLWTDRYDRRVDKIFAVYDDIMRSIAGVLGGLYGTVAQAEAERLSAKHPNSFTAYDYFTKGRDRLYEAVNGKQGANIANIEARKLFEKARQEDPNYARVYAGLAWTYELDYDYEWTKDYDNALEQAYENATTAVRLDPYDYQAHWIMGWAHLYKLEHEKAKAEYERARSMNPYDAELLAEMGNFLVYMGQPKQAIDQLTEAIRLNPKHEDWYVEYLGWAYEHADMPKEAVQKLESVIEQPATKEQLWLLPTLAAAYAESGRMDDAHRVKDQILSLEPEFSSAEFASRGPYKTKELSDRYIRGLRQAGLPE